MEGNKMNTKTLTALNVATQHKLLEMWQENTGRHMLDSGGAYGRNWERNQEKTLEDLTESEGRFVKDLTLSLNTFTFLSKHLWFTDEARALTDLFRAWVDDQPKYEAYYNAPGSMEDFLLEQGAVPQWMDTEIMSFNTYNWENWADATLQGVAFALGDGNYTALSYHGGADVRGGYTDLVIFESCSSWLVEMSDIEVWCDTCKIHGSIRGMCDENYYKDGDQVEIPDGYDVMAGCIECNGDWEVNSLECSGE
jgi:hypothetical protein